MSERANVILTTLTISFLSFLAGFFVLANAIFSDVFRFSEHMLGFLYAIIVYAVLGFSATVIDPKRWRRWAWILGLPAAVFVVLFSLSEVGSRLVLHATYLLMATNGIAIGLWAALQVRGKNSQADRSLVEAALKRVWVWLIGATLIGVLLSAAVL